MRTNDELSLSWNGPFGIGNFPTSAEEFETRGVYVLHYRYEKANKDAIYVGSVRSADRNRSIHKRIREHYNGILGFGYWLRDENGDWDRSTKPDQHFFDRLDEIDQSVEKSVREAKRMRFYFTKVDDADLHMVLRAESLLIVHFRNSPEAAEGNGSRRRLVLDNDNRLPVREGNINLMLINDLTQLETSSWLKESLPHKISP